MDLATLWAIYPHKQPVALRGTLSKEPIFLGNFFPRQRLRANFDKN
jgi:hypothetical protein